MGVFSAAAPPDRFQQTGDARLRRPTDSFTESLSGPEHRQAAEEVRTSWPAALFAARGALRRAMIFERLATLSDMQAEDIMFHRLPRCFMVVTAVCRERRAARMPTVEDNQPPEKGALGVPQGSPSRTKGGPGAG